MLFQNIDETSFFFFCEKLARIKIICNNSLHHNPTLSNLYKTLKSNSCRSEVLSKLAIVEDYNRGQVQINQRGLCNV